MISGIDSIFKSSLVFRLAHTRAVTCFFSSSLHRSLRSSQSNENLTAQRNGGDDSIIPFSAHRDCMKGISKKIFASPCRLCMVDPQPRWIHSLSSLTFSRKITQSWPNWLFRTSGTRSLGVQVSNWTCHLDWDLTCNRPNVVSSLSESSHSKVCAQCLIFPVEPGPL